MGRTLFLLSCLLLTLSGCSSVLIVKSDPTQVDVFFQDSQTGDRKSLGKTPLELPMATLKETVGETASSGEFFTIVLEKQGYETQKIMLPASRFGTLVTTVDAKLKTGQGPKESQQANDILNRLFMARKLALLRQYERAHLEVDKILTENPGFARGMSMRASIYYMQKNFTDSLKWYEEALKIDPQMEDAVQMLAKVRQRTVAGKQGGKP